MARTHLALVVLALAVVGCGDNSAKGTGTSPVSAPADRGDSPEGEPVPGTTDDGPAEPVEPPPPALADSPRIDLVDNRFMWHLSSSAESLLIPAATEGFRKYTQEYKQPWGGVVELDGRTGRTLSKARTDLRFPWSRGTGEATLRFRVHGVRSKQKITVRLNGKKVGAVTVGAGWQIASMTIAADRLRVGENDLRLDMSRRGSAGGKRTYALWSSIEIIEGTAADSDEWPELSVAHDGALGGFARLTMLVEVPPDAYLRVDTTATAAVGVAATARQVDGTDHVLFEHTHDGAGTEQHQISLAHLAGTLVALELSVVDGDPATVAWEQPRVALAEAAVRERLPPVQNAILFVIDTLRSDRLAAYVDTRVKTPRITALVEERGAVFLTNSAASPSSPPSHTSIQTGSPPRIHGVNGDKGQLVKGTPMISTVLGAADVSPAYIGNNSFAMSRLKKKGKWDKFYEPVFSGHNIDCPPIVDNVLKFAQARSDAGERFFISALPMEPHTPYHFRDGITENYYAGPYKKPIGKKAGSATISSITAGKLKMNDTRWEQLHALYDGEVEYVDGCFGTMLDGLEEMGRLDDTAIILTSDHGEGMYEHGRMGHAFGHYAELSNVPFIVFHPGIQGARKISTASSHLDIAPTLIDLMGVDIPEVMQGESMLPLIARDGPWTPRVVVSEYGRSFALRSYGWKYIVGYHGEEKLYDSIADPTEQTELQELSPMALRYMRDMTGFYLAHRRVWRGATFGTLNNHGAGFVTHVGDQ
jgi:arylsulfatase A-like enzyme